jgi:magnesium transporter
MLTRHPEHLHEAVADVQELLQRHRVLSTMARRQESAPVDRRDLLEILQERQNLAELERKLGALHPADLAHILEVLPQEERRLLWDHLSASQRGLVLVELSTPTRSGLIESLPGDALAASLSVLDPDDLAYLADDLPPDLMAEVSRRLDAGQQSLLEESITFDERSVGAMMSRDAIALRDSMNVSEVLTELRGLETLPGHTDRIFIVDMRHVLRGAVPLTRLLLAAP